MLKIEDFLKIAMVQDHKWFNNQVDPFKQIYFIEIICKSQIQTHAHTHHKENKKLVIDHSM